MTSDAFIDDTIRQRILSELDRIEREEDVHILVAVESGSRAWRFPSQDSDYDVRFVYVRPLESYLSIAERRDVIERPIDELLDVSGWDLRKALQLLVRSNAVLLEWLTSPVRYRESNGAITRLLNLARTGADLKALTYHYKHQAQRSLEEVQSTQSVRHKSYCYALRSALALRWLSQRNEPPPMDLPSLLSGLELDEDARASVASLLALKLQSTESDTGSREPILDDLIKTALAQSVGQRHTTARTEIVAQADTLFASVLIEAFQARTR